jgi:hypothetical protein
MATTQKDRYEVNIVGAGVVSVLVVSGVEVLKFVPSIALTLVIFSYVLFSSLELR